LSNLLWDRDHLAAIARDEQWMRENELGHLTAALKKIASDGYQRVVDAWSSEVTNLSQAARTEAERYIGIQGIEHELTRCALAAAKYAADWVTPDAPVPQEAARLAVNRAVRGVIATVRDARAKGVVEHCSGLAQDCVDKSKDEALKWPTVKKNALACANVAARDALLQHRRQSEATRDADAAIDRVASAFKDEVDALARSYLDRIDMGERAYQACRRDALALDAAKRVGYEWDGAYKMAQEEYDRHLSRQLGKAAREFAEQALGSGSKGSPPAQFWRMTTDNSEGSARVAILARLNASFRRWMCPDAKADGPLPELVPPAPVCEGKASAARPAGLPAALRGRSDFTPEANNKTLSQLWRTPQGLRPRIWIHGSAGKTKLEARLVNKDGWKVTLEFRLEDAAVRAAFGAKEQEGVVTCTFDLREDTLNFDVADDPFEARLA
jgi:hypothetical protein